MRVTRLDDAPTYVAERHREVHGRRLQGMEAGPTENYWVSISYYLPGGCAEHSPTKGETVYVVLDGELVVSADGREETLRQHDSVHLAAGESRSVENRSARPATLLVVVSQ